MNYFSTEGIVKKKQVLETASLNVLFPYSEHEMLTDLIKMNETRCTTLP